MAGSKKKPGGGSTPAPRGTGTMSHADAAFVRKKRGKLVHEEEEEAGELNIVPYLDILMVLIMFLLVAQATLVSLGLIDVSAPSYAKVGASDNDQQDNKKKLRLTVGIAKSGFFIAAKGGVLPGQEEAGSGELTAAGAEKSRPTIPVKADGSPDYATLARKLRGIKSAFPDTTAVYVAADDNTPYEVIVKTLDATREDAKGLMFPNVAFTQIR